MLVHFLYSNKGGDILGSYTQFSILEIIPDLSKKRITIKTNFKVDVSTVTLKTVGLYNYDKAKLETYKLTVDNKEIYIDLTNYPTNGSRYYLKVVGLKDALGRSLSASYDDYIKFVNDIKTTVEIISPVSRETYKDRTIDIGLKIKMPADNIQYRIEVGIDNVFFNKVTTLVCKVPYMGIEDLGNQFIEIDKDSILSDNNGVPIVFNSAEYSSDSLTLSTTIEREGQIYIRARAESSNSEDFIAGDWSETISFNILTISTDSLETTFLEDYLTSSDLFESEDEETAVNPTLILSKSAPGTNDEMFFIELNKEVYLKDKVPNEDGYISLGTIIGFGKEVK